MRYLGIDYGSRRIGLALSDEEGRIAFPRHTLQRLSDAQAVRKIAALVKKERIGTVVVGLPWGLDGNDTDQTRAARSFGEKLGRALVIPIAYENEMFTTRMAHASGADKKHVHESSAALILQSFLDKRKK